MPIKRTDRLGEISKNKQGLTMKIIKYINANDIDVLFIETKEVFKRVTYNRFKSGVIQSKFSPTVHNFGILGDENIRDCNGDFLDSYNKWRYMIGRCYSSNSINIHPEYKECFVCDEWKYYKNFKKWYNENYYNIKDEKMHLDKDILVKGNKIYSPETCIFVPSRINYLFLQSNKTRGDLPIGVNYNENNKFFIRVRIDNKIICRYGFNNKYDAFHCYKIEKEKYIKQVADKYKNKIPNKLYESMYKWKIEITD